AVAHRRERGDRSPAPPQSAPGRAARSRAGRGRRPPRCDHGAARPVGATAGGARRAAAPASHGGRAVRRGRLLARRDRGHPRHPRGHRALGGVPRASPAARTAGRLEGAGMTREPLPFDHRPDPALGAALRQALEPPEGSHAAFVARLLARVDDSRGAGSWDRVLARWARVGVAGRALWGRVAYGGAPERGRGVEPLVAELTDELALTPVQRDSVHAILQRHFTRMAAVWDTVRPRFDALRAEMDSEVTAHLT